MSANTKPKNILLLFNPTYRSKNHAYKEVQRDFVFSCYQLK